MSLLGTLASKATGLLGGLSGWQGYVGAAVLAFGAGAWAAHHYDGLVADREALERQQVYDQGLKLINAANEAQAAVAAEDARRALAAAEAAAAAERERAEKLADQIEAIKAIPDAENCALGLETMKILEGLM